MLERLDSRANQRIAGRAWDKIRPQISRVHESLISMSPSVSGALTTIYVKYTSNETGTQPFAVLWIKKASEIVLGLALPDGYEIDSQFIADTDTVYSGLTVYLKFRPGDEIPENLDEWVSEAFRNSAGA
jgi:hypothetical protein